MKQAKLGLELSTKRTRKREFLDEMDSVVPWADLVALIAVVAPQGKRGRPPFSLHSMLRIHFMQQWFGLSDPAMEEALHDTPMYRDFAQLDWEQRLPDETTILRFRHLLEAHQLAGQGLLLRRGSVVDATLIAAPVSTKNAKGRRDPAMHQTILCATPVASPAAKLAGGAMLAGQFAPMFPLELVEKDFAYALHAGLQASSSLPVVAAVHGVLAGAVRGGLGQSNVTGLASLY